MKKFYLIIFLALLPCRLFAQFAVGDRVSFPDNNWLWTVDIVRPDLGGASLVADGIDGEQRRLFLENARIFPIADLVDGIAAGSCYKIAGNRFIWQVLGLTPAVAGLTAAKAFMFNNEVPPRAQRRAVLLTDLAERFECPAPATPAGKSDSSS